MEKDTEGKCRVCGGQIVEKIVRERNPATGPPVIGPASKNQFYEASKGFHCKECKIKYESVPKS